MHDVLQQRTDQMLWSHQYGHDQCAFKDKAEALAQQAAATHPLQLRPCVLRRPGEPLAPSGSRSVRPKGNAAGVDEQQSVSAPRQSGTLRRPRDPLGPVAVTKCQAKNEYTATATAITSFRCLNTLSQCIQVMVEKGTSKRHVGLCPMAR